MRGEERSGGGIELDPEDLAVTRVELAPQRAGVRLPHLQRAVAAANGDQRAVGRERDRVDRLAEGSQLSEPRAARDRPERYLPGCRAGHEAAPRVRRQAADRSGNGQDLLPAAGVEDARFLAPR